MQTIGFFRWLGLAVAALSSTLILTAPASAQGTNRVSREPWNFRPARCQVPGIIDAATINVIAGDCRPGSWGFDRNGVWVNNGCRGRFQLF